MIVDPQSKKTEVYELINYQYEPVAVNPETNSFHFDGTCNMDVAFENIWV